MRFSDYINDRKNMLLVCCVGYLFLSAVLLSLGINLSVLFLLWLCFIITTFATAFYNYRQQQKRIHYLLSVSDSLDQKYLIAEIADEPENKLEQIYFQLMKTALKTMTDEVAGAYRMNNEYREFIEQWIHEIKVPITGIQLICENNKTDITRTIMTQSEMIEQEVERVLFYARLENAEKDYFIKEVSLKECVAEVLSRNKQFLIQNDVCVRTDNISDTVLSDNKWLCFILNQIVFNSIKYRSSRPPVIQIESQDKGNYVSLSITDNGIGIKASELNRVFDKGFLGSNGRTVKSATGMGLYLCARLCEKLGIDIDVESEEKRYTTIRLHFPKSDYLRV